MVLIDHFPNLCNWATVLTTLLSDYCSLRMTWTFFWTEIWRNDKWWLTISSGICDSFWLSLALEQYLCPDIRGHDKTLKLQVWKWLRQNACFICAHELQAILLILIFGAVVSLVWKNRYNSATSQDQCMVFM